MPVLDGRAVAPTFDEAGFELLAAPSDVVDWTSTAELDEVHAPEVDELARSFTGCDHAVVYPSLVRSPDVAAEIDDYAPIETVHSDFTDDYRRMIVEPDRPYRAFLDPLLDRRGLDVDDVRRASRVMMLQLWRNTGPAEADRPLAFLDARAVGEERLVRMVVPTYGGERLDFETFLVRPPADGVDEWCSFPHLTPDEVVALRTYDSARDDAGLPYWTPHSAFRHPDVPETPEHRRQSVEMRALCLWA